MINETIQIFLKITEMPKSNFCKNAGISESYLWDILHGRNVSNKTANNINEFINDRLSQLAELTKQLQEGK